MPNFQARNERAETLAILLNKKNGQLCHKWQGLKTYIADVVGWGDLQKPKLEAAGWTHYEKASRNNWANSKIVNTGSVTLWVDSGETSTQSANAVQLDPETDMPVPGEVATVYNNDAVIAGQFEARMVVD